MADPLVSLEGVTKTYPGVPEPVRVLDGVDLVVEAGARVAIAGPSGCGKSTLLHLMGALDQPTTGRVCVGGRDLAGLDERERAALRNAEVGFVFQLHHLLPQCTVLENVLVPAMVHPQQEDAVARAKMLLERAGIAARANHLPGQLSGGERQRAAVVRALINRPRLLLADEPTGSLNQEGAESLTQLLLDLNRDEGTALVIVTHAEDVARRMDRIYDLRGGVLHERAAQHA